MCRTRRPAASTYSALVGPCPAKPISIPGSAQAGSQNSRRLAGAAVKQGKTILCAWGRIYVGLVERDEELRQGVLTLLGHHLAEFYGQKPRAVLERFLQLALDGAWTLTDRAA
jgi:hypothetical protein